MIAVSERAGCPWCEGQGECAVCEANEMEKIRNAAFALQGHARERIEQCRRDEQKFGAGAVAIEASIERRTWQAALSFFGEVTT